jgi:hypothetical protein
VHRAVVESEPAGVHAEVEVVIRMAGGSSHGSCLVRCPFCLSLVAVVVVVVIVVVVKG